MVIAKTKYKIFLGLNKTEISTKNKIKGIFCLNNLLANNFSIVEKTTNLLTTQFQNFTIFMKGKNFQSMFLNTTCKKMLKCFSI